MKILDSQGRLFGKHSRLRCRLGDSAGSGGHLSFPAPPVPLPKSALPLNQLR